MKGCHRSCWGGVGWVIKGCHGSCRGGWVMKGWGESCWGGVGHEGVRWVM